MKKTTNKQQQQQKSRPKTPFMEFSKRLMVAEIASSVVRTKQGSD